MATKVPNYTVYGNFVLMSVRRDFCDWKHEDSDTSFRIHRNGNIENRNTTKVYAGSDVDNEMTISLKKPKMTVVIPRRNLLDQVYLYMDIVNVPPSMRADGAIIGYPGYIFTTFGCIWSVRQKAWVYGCTTDDRVHYTITCVKAWRFMLAKAMAQLFLRNPHNHKHVGFLDGDTTNLNIDNLVWVASRKECYRPEFVRYKMDEADFNASRIRIGIENHYKFEKQFKAYTTAVDKAHKHIQK